MIKAFARDSARYLPSVAVPAVVAFISIPLLTKMFPAARYGDYRLVLTTLGVFGAVTLWLPSSVIRFFPEFEVAGRLATFYGSTARLWAFNAAAVAGIWFLPLLLLHGRIRPELWQMLLVGGAVLLLNDLFGLLVTFLRSQGKVAWYSFGEVWRSLVALLIGLGLVAAAGAGIVAFLWGTVAAVAVALPMLWRKVTHGLDRSTWSSGLDRPLAVDMARYAIPLVMGASAAWALRLSDRYILELFAGPAEVGVYAASYGLAEQSIGVIVTLFQLPFVVMANQIWERSGVEASAVFVQRVTRFYLIVVLPAVVGLSVLARPLVEVLTDVEYLGGYRILPYVAVASALLGFQYWYLSAFMFRKRMVFYTLSVGVGAVVNIGLNFLLVPSYGYPAAAVTSLIGYAAVLVVMVPISRRYFIWRFPFATLARVAGAGAVMGVALGGLLWITDLPAWLDLVAGVAVGVLVYGAALWATGELSPAELALARSRLSRGPGSSGTGED